MVDVSKAIGRAAAMDLPVLIQGRTGTGKDLIARVIHHHSKRSDRPLVRVDCSCPPGLLEHQLFGYRPGAFRGAIDDRPGPIELADQGTLWLDEIGDLDRNVQARLIDLIEKRVVERVGGGGPIPVDVRIIATSRADLELSVRNGRFDQNLLFELAAIDIHLPSLEERREDIPCLARHFVQKHGPELGHVCPSITPPAIEFLNSRSWPGNVRELESVLRKSLLEANGFPVTKEIVQRVCPHPPPRSHPSGLTAGAPIWRRQRPAVPGYHLCREIDEGAYGLVWLAHSADGYCALKVIRRDGLRDAGLFEQEFSALQKLATLSQNLDGLVRILHAGRNRSLGYYYYAMELADDCSGQLEVSPETYQARTLATEIRSKVIMAPSDCVEIGTVLAAALQRLHANEIIHGNIKPANVLFIKGLPKLADVGLAHLLGGFSGHGMPGYAPPEGPGRAQGDVYSLGKIIYEIMTGFDRRTFPRPPDTPTPELQALWSVVSKACESHALHRYRSAKELHDALVSLRQTSPEPHPR
jgi:hypothetical protein